MTTHLIEPKLNERFKGLMAEFGHARCPRCQHELDLACAAWNNPTTAAGTPYCMIDIVCVACSTGILHMGVERDLKADDFRV